MSEYKFHVCNWCNEYSKDPNTGRAQVIFVHPNNARNIEMIEGYRYLIRLNNKQTICLKCYLK